MIVWNGMDIIGLIILGLIAVCIILLTIFLTLGSKISEHRKKRWERVLKSKEKKVTCYGCKHLWMSNIGTYECLINKEKACIDNKANKRYLYEASENKEGEE